MISKIIFKNWIIKDILKVDFLQYRTDKFKISLNIFYLYLDSITQEKQFLNRKYIYKTFKEILLFES